MGDTFSLDHHIIVQRATREAPAPHSKLLRQYVIKVLDQLQIKSVEVTIRIVGIEEMINLNHTFRQKMKPTNILSFPADLPKDISLPLTILGDIVICAAVVNQEALEQHKESSAHWAHMIVHGLCHLLGYDHETDAEAEVMESLESKIMNSLGFDNPYKNGDDIS